MVEAPTQPAASRQPKVANISLMLRIPPFWRDRARLWFYSFEAATQDTKKGQVQGQMLIAQLEKQDIEQITDLLYNPPKKDYYTVIKERLIAAYEESDSRQFQKLLSEIELGDQKPTQILRRMRDLAGNRIPDTTLRHLWTNHLPPHIHFVLPVSESFGKQTALEALALLADKTLEQTQEVASINPTPQPTSQVDVHY